MSESVYSLVFCPRCEERPLLYEAGVDGAVCTSCGEIPWPEFELAPVRAVPIRTL